MSVRESSVTGDEALLLRTVNAARFAREGWAGFTVLLPVTANVQFIRC